MRLAGVSRLGCAVLVAAAALGAESPQESARQAIETSVARQRAAVALMRVSVEKQRAAAQVGAAQARSEAAAAPVPPPFFTLSWPAIGGSCDPLPAAEAGDLIRQAAQTAGLQEDLLRAVAEQESGLRPCAVSPRGAMGLMQLMPGTAEDLGVRDPFDPRENLFSGARFLKQLLTRFGGDTGLALAAYNAGPGRVEDTGGIPPIPETLRYVQTILSRLPIP